MKSRFLFALAALGLALAATPARADLSYTGVYTPVVYLPITSMCKFASGTGATSADLANPYYKQILILPTGFAEADRSTFWSEFNRTITSVTGPGAGSSWSVQKKDRIIFCGYFMPGGALGTSSATFGGKIASHPVRGFALSLSLDAVYAQVKTIQSSSITGLRPLGVGVLFNSFQTGITANAAPPSFTGKDFGIAKFTRNDLNSSYVPTHELAHASLNLLDEYVEPGLQDLNIRQLDILTPLALFDGSWGGFINAISDLFNVYDYNISEILADNGNVNISLHQYPDTVSTSGYGGQRFAYQGGMFFGLGTWHQQGNNLMNGGFVKRGDGDDFAYAHSADQQEVIENAFGAPPVRPNDRLRNAGPLDGWPAVFGSTTHVMLYDGDKLARFHPTVAWDVEVGWYDRVWTTCYAGGWFPYPCETDVWRSARKSVAPARRTIGVDTSALNSVAGLTQTVLCALGVTEAPVSGGSFKLCEQDISTMEQNFLPTIKFPLPYQDVEVPADQWFTTYYWRFRSDNGTMKSGWTGWSSFYRSF